MKALGSKLEKEILIKHSIELSLLRETSFHNLLGNLEAASKEFCPEPRK